jgi:hypothetical protein
MPPTKHHRRVSVAEPCRRLRLARDGRHRVQAPRRTTNTVEAPVHDADGGAQPPIPLLLRNLLTVVAPNKHWDHSSATPEVETELRHDLASDYLEGLKGTETWDRALDQVLLRVRSTCSNSAATMGRSRPSAGGDTCFVNIVGRYRPPCLTRSHEGPICRHGNGLRVPDQPNGPEGTPDQHRFPYPKVDAVWARH